MSLHEIKKPIDLNIKPQDSAVNMYCIHHITTPFPRELLEHGRDKDLGSSTVTVSCHDVVLFRKKRDNTQAGLTVNDTMYSQIERQNFTA